MSLTDDWKARKLKAGPYYVRLSNGRVDVAKLSKFNRFYAISYTFEVVEVLAPCDYEELKCVRDENNDLSALVTSNEIEIDHLCQLLKEVKEKIHNEFINQDIVSIDNFHKLLTKITEVLK
jgi:hypothetical protein